MKSYKNIHSFPFVRGINQIKTHKNISIHMQREMTKSTGVISLVFVAFSFCTILFGCTGVAGPDGDDAVISDTLSPVIKWLLPEAGSEVDSIEIISVSATDDQIIRRVVIYIAGWEASAELIDSTLGLYRYNWNSSDFPVGPYPLMAKAWDESSNQSSTPVVLVWK
jgi:hypothetical protein